MSLRKKLGEWLLGKQELTQAPQPFLSPTLEKFIKEETQQPHQKRFAEFLKDLEKQADAKKLMAFFLSAVPKQGTLQEEITCGVIFHNMGPADGINAIVMQALVLTQERDRRLFTTIERAEFVDELLTEARELIFKNMTQV